MSTTAVPTEDGTGYRINGTKLWATNGAIADVVVIMAVVPKSEGHRGGITAFICPCDREGITVEHRNEFMGLRGIENSVTRFDDVFVPTEDVIGGEGKGLRIALTTLNTGRLSLPAFCLSATKYSLKIAREWSAERKQWGQPDRQARPDRAEARLAGGHGVRPRGDARRVQPAGRRQAQRHPHRGRARQALRVGTGLDRRGRDGPDPRRSRLRDRRVAAAARREAGPGRADAARHAHQPHLRGLHGDHAPADRARGRRPAPEGGGRRGARRRRPRRQGEGRREGGRVLRQVVPDADDGRGPGPGSFSEFGTWPSTCATSSATRASSRARPSTRWAATRRGSSRRASCSAGSSTSAPSSTRSRARASTRHHRREQPDRRQEASNWPTCSAARPAVGPTGCSRAVGQRRRRQYEVAQQVLDGRYAWFEEDVLDPAGRAR